MSALSLRNWLRRIDQHLARLWNTSVRDAAAGNTKAVQQALVCLPGDCRKKSGNGR